MMMTPMARIRIVDEWLRSPVSPPTRHRAIMVIADTWSEQRVLMRAFAGSEDQTRPTIVLHGTELAIGPAGTDPHGHWGIHVEPPVDGRAQELRQQLELAAKRLAGSKGNPPRLVDEASPFERKATNNWERGAPRDRLSNPNAITKIGDGGEGRAGYYEPANVAPAVASPQIPSAAASPAPSPGVPASPVAASPAPSPGVPASPVPASPQRGSAAPGGPKDRRMMSTMPPTRRVQGGVPNPASSRNIQIEPTPGAPKRDSSVAITPPPMSATGAARKSPGYAAAYASAQTPSQPVAQASPQQARPRRRKKGWTSPVPPAGSEVDRRTPIPFDGTRTTPGFAPMNAPVRPMPRAKAPAPTTDPRTLASMVGHTMPLGFRLSDNERELLNALGKCGALKASEIAASIGVDNGIEWMDALIAKLSEHGLDLIEHGEEIDGEPTYTLRH